MKKILIIVLCLSITGCWETSKGEKIGTIVKLAAEGVIIKTWEGELIRGGMNNGSGSFGGSFHFTVETPALIEKAQEALRNQREVRIKYHKEMFSWLRTENKESYFVDEIEIIK
jgi:hypothetical protein